MKWLLEKRVQVARDFVFHWRKVYRRVNLLGESKVMVEGYTICVKGASSMRGLWNG